MPLSAQLIVLAISVMSVILVGEIIIKKIGGSNEASRKLVHVMHGVSLAALAFIVPMRYVVLCESVFLASMFVARYMSKSARPRQIISWYVARLYKVGRLSYGDLLFPLSVIIVSVLANTKWEFAAAMLVLGVADAVAAIVGKHFGKGNTYTVLGQAKSIAGSVAFFLVTASIIGMYAVLIPTFEASVALMGVLAVSFVLTITENLGVYGTDNFLLPIVTVLALSIAAQ